MKHKFGNVNYYLGNEIAKIRKARGYTVSVKYNVSIQLISEMI